MAVTKKTFHYGKTNEQIAYERHTEKMKKIKDIESNLNDGWTYTESGYYPLRRCKLFKNGKLVAKWFYPNDNALNSHMIYSIKGAYSEQA